MMSKIPPQELYRSMYADLESESDYLHGRLESEVQRCQEEMDRINEKVTSDFLAGESSFKATVMGQTVEVFIDPRKVETMPSSRMIKLSLTQIKKVNRQLKRAVASERRKVEQIRKLREQNHRLSKDLDRLYVEKEELSDLQWKPDESYPPTPYDMR